ncbi:5' nucleotidase, NT5C type [Nocardia iowensis]|uniref:Uncharacterized protein n=1 Tax=Nocardia iowensis TaxID=204891 RepID=A0ABX8RTB6_NOCIO|nr:hypothetical protein [Nocardia iowensis]QXN90736.1 hypothetical protein KV110_36010 [Nocardia iowensis]
MTPPSRPVLAVDLDDVCADRLGVIARDLRAQERPVPSDRPTRWDLRDWGVRDHDDYDRLHYGAFVTGDGYRTMAPLPGAVEGLRTLHESGFRIRVVTGRLWTSQIVGSVLAATGAWLDTHGIPAEDVVFVSDKTAVEADVYLEDAPHFIRDLRALNRAVLVFDQPYNRSFEQPRTTDWAMAVTWLTNAYAAGQVRN